MKLLLALLKFIVIEFLSEKFFQFLKIFSNRVSLKNIINFNVRTKAHCMRCNMSIEPLGRPTLCRSNFYNETSFKSPINFW